MKRIAIIGTRRRDTASVYGLIKDKFFEIYEEGDWIVSGRCKKGADRFAERLADDYGIPILLFPPNYRRYKMAAPIIRNKSIAQNSDFIIACVIRPEEGLDEVLKRKKGGTEDTLKKFVEFSPTPRERIFLV